MLFPEDFRLIVTSNFDLGFAEFETIFGKEAEKARHLWEKYVEYDRRIDIFMQRLDKRNLNALFSWMVTHARESLPDRKFAFEYYSNLVDF